MIYEAKLLGAAAVLLICAILTEEELKSYLALADSLGLSAWLRPMTGRRWKWLFGAGQGLSESITGI